MLFITAFGAVVLLPFILGDISFLFDLRNLFILVLSSSFILAAGLLGFEALRVGKIAVVEPVNAVEVPVTAALSWFLLGEHLNFFQFFLVTAIIVGIFLVSTRSFKHFKGAHLERGVWIAFVATVCMGAANFLIGVSARETSPLFINWFLDVFIFIVMALYLRFSGQTGSIAKVWKTEKKLVLAVCFFDNLAWVAYALAAVFIPIAIAIGISESYVALAALLGIYFNKEKLSKHQKAGLAITVFAAVVLAFFSEL
jgi:drug/metabolite transporter (DMT)-like permease